MADLVVDRVALSELDHGAPQHEFGVVVLKVFSGVGNVSGQLLTKLIYIVWPLVFRVLKASAQMNCNFANVQLSLVKINAYDIDLPLGLNGVQICLNELAASNILEIRGNDLLADVDHGRFLGLR